MRVKAPFSLNFEPQHTPSWPGLPPSHRPPNKALQLTGHSAFQSIHGTIWHSTRRFEPPGQQAGS
jgi:hypothetical protein